MDNNEQPQQGQTEQKSEILEPDHQTTESIMEQSMEPPRLKHSGLGIASFTIAILAIILTIVVSTMITNIVSSVDIENFNIEDQTALEQQLVEILEDNPELPAVFMLFFLIGILALIGGVLGIIGLFIKQRKKLFAILGTILNFLGIPILGIFILAIAFL